MKNDNNTHPLAAIENAAQIVVHNDSKPLLAGCVTSPVQAGCVLSPVLAGCVVRAACAESPVLAGCVPAPVLAGCVIDSVGVMAKRK